jgi:CDP-diacylglycerol--serine O-phosphatidyltransferase
MVLNFRSYEGAFIFIVLAAVFDFLDGLAARLLKAHSPVGADLDSLADVVSFGVAPGCIIYVCLMQLNLHNVLINNTLPMIAFVLPVFAALRLAKFNVDTRQTTSFRGLPVPACALFWASFIPAIQTLGLSSPVGSTVIILFLLFAFSFLMISEIPMFSLKFKNLRWKENEYPFSLILISVLLISVCSYFHKYFTGVSLTIIAYIIMSLVKNAMKK